MLSPLLRITLTVPRYGEHGQDRVYAGAAERCPEAAVVVPPHTTAVPGETAETAPTQRDRHLQHVEPRGSPDIAGHGRMAWQAASSAPSRSAGLGMPPADSQGRPISWPPPRARLL